MRHELGFLVGGMAFAAAIAIAACSSDDTLDLSSSSSSSSSSTGEGGGDSCPTDTCSPGCGAGTTCCNGRCVDLGNDLFNCGQCCKSCPNPNPICEAGECGHAVCNKAMFDCEASQFCCDQECCDTGAVCCPSGAGYVCAQPDVNGICPN